MILINRKFLNRRLVEQQFLNVGIEWRNQNHEMSILIANFAEKNYSKENTLMAKNLFQNK